MTVSESVFEGISSRYAFFIAAGIGALFEGPKAGNLLAIGSFSPYRHSTSWGGLSFA